MKDMTVESSEDAWGTAQSRVLDRGVPCMTPDTLRVCCSKNKGFSDPKLNDVLLLHYKGFRKIDGLDAYINVRSLFLECNGIARIENLEVVPELISLYLQNNCISRIENLGCLPRLRYLNLAHNSISIVENLAPMQSLETLNLAANKFVDVESLHGLANCGTLKSVDVSGNYIEDGDDFVSLWPVLLPNVECLYLHGNPCHRLLRDYRRRLVSGLPFLRWLDERPVTAMDRIGSEAWSRGGKDAELEAKRALHAEDWRGRAKGLQDFQRVGLAHAERLLARQAGTLGHGTEERPAFPLALPPSRETEMQTKVGALLATRGFATSCNYAPAGAEGMLELRADVERVVDTSAVDDSHDTHPSVDAENVSEAVPGQPNVWTPGVTASSLEALSESPRTFVWTSVRDNRLGRLVAEHRYVFRRAASSMSLEFEFVDEAECRRRYGELTRQSKTCVKAQATNAVKPSGLVFAPPPRSRHLAQLEVISEKCCDDGHGVQDQLVALHAQDSGPCAVVKRETIAVGLDSGLSTLD